MREDDSKKGQQEKSGRYEKLSELKKEGKWTCVIARQTTKPLLNRRGGVVFRPFGNAIVPVSSLRFSNDQCLSVVDNGLRCRRIPPNFSGR